jgi:beta-glucanase (GH16 family)
MNMCSTLTRSCFAALALVLVLFSCSTLSADSITLSNSPLTLTAGQSYEVAATYETSASSIVKIQLFDSDWNEVVGDWSTVTSSSSSVSFTLSIPAGQSAASTYHWQAVLFDDSWGSLAEDNVWSVSVTSTEDSISLTADSTLVAGNTYTVTTDYTLQESGIAMVQLFSSTWSSLVSDWTTVDAGTGQESFSLTIPADTTAGSSYIWQSILTDDSWNKLDEDVQYNITIEADQSSGEWLPDGTWELDWSDEFSGSGDVDDWYPMLGWTPTDFLNNTEKGLRWTGDTEDTARMYSTKTGNHWLNGEGQLVLRAIVDKTSSNTHGNKVETAYLQTGYPDEWDDTEPSGVKWNGQFFSPEDGSLYISTRVRTDQLQGYATWFAFWLHSQTRAYNDTPSDGTEVDVVEIVKSNDDWAQQSFNVANHWNQDGGSESHMFETGTDPSSLDYVNVDDSDYHIYGIEWTTEYIKCSVDGQVYYTFTDNIPTEPVDMMILLTMEYEEDGWWGITGDGRSEGPYVSDDTDMREMSRVLVDYVRVYQKQ